jgi:hypothetical protein
MAYFRIGWNLGLGKEPRGEASRRGSGGSDGLRSHARTTPTWYVLVGLPPTRRTVGVSGRAPYARLRARRLSAGERAQVQALSGTKSLRSLAADFGVSHETIRAVLAPKRFA